MERLHSYDIAVLAALLSRYSLKLKHIPSETAIPGSFWGDEEAGLIGNTLSVRSDTPIHSCLHESCHFICMSEDRRKQLHTNAGGTSDEENAVCFLQIILSDQAGLPGRFQAFKDMDEWGYSFRLGSAQAWFDQDAEDARIWLLQHQLIDSHSEPTFLLRQ